MARILMIVCLLVAILAGVMLFIEEPKTFIIWVGGWLGFLYFRYKMFDDIDSEGKPPQHRPRHKAAKTPSWND